MAANHTLRFTTGELLTIAFALQSAIDDQKRTILDHYAAGEEPNGEDFAKLHHTMSLLERIDRIHRDRERTRPKE